MPWLMILQLFQSKIGKVVFKFIKNKELRKWLKKGLFHKDFFEKGLGKDLVDKGFLKKGFKKALFDKTFKKVLFNGQKLKRKPTTPQEV